MELKGKPTWLQNFWNSCIPIFTIPFFSELQFSPEQLEDITPCHLLVQILCEIKLQYRVRLQLRYWSAETMKDDAWQEHDKAERCVTFCKGDGEEKKAWRALSHKVSKKVLSCHIGSPWAKSVSMLEKCCYFFCYHFLTQNSICILFLKS